MISGDTLISRWTMRQLRQHREELGTDGAHITLGRPYPRATGVSAQKGNKAQFDKKLLTKWLSLS
jgi:hypothetical protein